MTANSALNYLVFSATQDNSINGDLGGASINSTASFTLLGVFTSQSLSSPITLATPGALSLVQDTGASSSDGLTSNSAVKGTAAAGATVTLYEGGTSLGTAVADGSGQWTITPSGFTQGAHTVTATATDGSGNVSATSTSFTFTLDTVPPAVPSAPALTAASDSGVSNTDCITNVATPTMTGTADAGSTVTIRVDGVAVGTTTASGAGVWSHVLVTALPNGMHNLTALATDAAGNASAFSTALSMTIDTVAPGEPSPYSRQRQRRPRR